MKKLVIPALGGGGQPHNVSKEAGKFNLVNKKKYLTNILTYSPLHYENSDCFKNHKITAFTLAEVLITLSIIGIVAAMTMPSLISKYQEYQYINKMKKVYSVFSNAYISVMQENGSSSTWEQLPPDYEKDEDGNVVKDKWGNPSNNSTYKNSLNTFNLFKPYLNIVKECDKAENGCFTDSMTLWYDNEEVNLVTSIFGARKFAILADGTSIGFLRNSVIYFDLNGLKKPNVVGIDIFQFNIGPNGLELPDSPKNDVLKCYTSAYACSAWVMINENMDYLHCTDLSWKGKTKCK